MDFPVQSGTMEARRCGGISGGIFLSIGGYFWQRCFCGVKMPLTDVEIRRAKTKDKSYRMSDGGSLYLWVTPSGGKLWRWAFTHEGKEKLMAFGKYPDVPLVLARERHAEARKLLAIGIDPMEQRKIAKTAEKAAAENSFRTIAGLWFEHWRAEKSAQHVDATRRRMDANIMPLLGTRPITEIEAPELVTMVKMIEAGVLLI